MIEKKWLYQKYIIEKLSMTSIGKLINKSERGVAYWLKKHKIKIRTKSEMRKHIHFTGEYRLNCSLSKIGSKNPNYGKKFSKEYKQKLSLSQRKGKNHYNWKGGISTVAKTLRSSSKYREWRQNIFERDNFTCQKCSQYGSALNADHIIPFSFLLSEHKITNFEDGLKCEELWCINNGRTLCIECHKMTETYKSKARNFTSVLG